MAAPHEREKLSIYPASTPDILLVDTPSPLEQQIGIARRKIAQTFHDTHSQVQDVVSRWIGVEHAVENRVKSIISPDEQLTPAVLYVGVATLSGSILARNRFLPTRLLLPPVFLLVSTNYFLPKTSENLVSYLASLENTYFPALAQKHDIANAHTRMTWERIKDSTQNSRAWVNRGAETTVHTIQELTGLKLREALGWTHAVAQKAEDKVNGTADRTFDRMKEKVEKKVDEIRKSA